jgi:hypothetical protein
LEGKVHGYSVLAPIIKKRVTLKIFRTGFFCVCALIASTAASAQSQESVPADPAPQNPTSQHSEAAAPAEAQNPTSQSPQQQTPPTTPPTTPSTSQQPGTSTLGPNVQAPPELPKYPDVRLPGEYGFYIGVNAWFPKQQPTFDKGRNSGIPDSSFVTMQGTPKLAQGLDLGMAIGLHNSLRFSWFETRASGNFTTVPQLAVWDQIYAAGTYVTTDYLVQNAKLSFDFLTWPYPVESRRFRFKTLWQVQYTSARSGFDAPLLATTDAAGNPLIDFNGNPLTYKTGGTKWFVLPTFGAEVSEYFTKNIHVAVSGDGFAIPHHSTLYEAEGTLAAHFGHFEIRAGGKLFHFKTSTNAQFYMRGTFAAPFIGIRWFSR